MSDSDPGRNQSLSEFAVADHDVPGCCALASESAGTVEPPPGRRRRPRDSVSGELDIACGPARGGGGVSARKPVTTAAR